MAFYAQVTPALVTLVYKGADGTEYTQPVSDLVESGTLVDPVTDQDMEVYAVIIPSGY